MLVAGNELARLNYFGVFSGMQEGDLSFPNNPQPAKPSQWAVFDANRCTTIAQIRDGTSNTMCIAEGLTGPQDYTRGFVWSDQAAGSIVFTQLAPNSPLARRMLSGFGVVPEHAGGKPAFAPGNGAWDQTADRTCAARSRHPGGVQVLMADGSVQWISDSIDSHPVGDPLYPGTWQKLATIDGGEVCRVLIYDADLANSYVGWVTERSPTKDLTLHLVGLRCVDPPYFPTL